MSNTPSKLSISELWRIDGTVSRRRYLGLGLSLFLIKYGIDSSVSWFFFHRTWFILDYFMPGAALDVVSTTPALRLYYLTMIVLALPFIWCGVALTLRRLRAANLPPWLVKLFFVPLVNVMLFSVLSILPTREEDEEAVSKLTAGETTTTGTVQPRSTPVYQKDFQPLSLSESAGRQLGKQLGQHQQGQLSPAEFFQPFGKERVYSALVSILVPLPIAYALAIFGTQILQSYGWGLFVGIPFAVGMTSVVLYGRKHPRKLVESLIVSSLAIFGLSGLLFAFGVEGVVCMLMASPIALVIGSMGAILGWAVQRRPTRPDESILIRLSIFLFLPFLMGAEYAASPEAPLFALRSSIDIDAPPAVVWRNLVSFSKLPPPTELLFRTGVAYPVRAIIYGHGVGAVRHCIFSTGPFIEPIQIWDEPRLLKFSVSSQPQPMFEWSFYKNLDPPHLDGFLRSRQGQFLLTPLSNGGTRLEGTTWYQHHMWPASYWRIWSDAIIHQIHMRVLTHIKHLSQTNLS